MRVRPPAVAGYFYPSNKEELISLIEKCFLHEIGPGKLPENLTENRKIVGAVVPHAGYVYSGPIAAHVYYELSKEKIPEKLIIIGLNHYGIGSDASTTYGYSWETPLGIVSVDNELAKEIIKTGTVVDSILEHYKEHSIEVQLPFLQYIYKNNFKFVPISLTYQEKDFVLELGEALYNVLKDRDFLIIASSDFSHYISYNIAYNKDIKLIKKILESDIDGFYKTLYEDRVSACGYGCIATLMYVMKKIGAKGYLLKYATSGDITGEKDQVVGYAGIIFKK